MPPLSDTSSIAFNNPNSDVALAYVTHNPPMPQFLRCPSSADPPSPPPLPLLLLSLSCRQCAPSSPSSLRCPFWLGPARLAARRGAGGAAVEKKTQGAAWTDAKILKACEGKTIDEKMEMFRTLVCFFVLSWALAGGGGGVHVNLFRQFTA
eukprot:5415721-Pyramimonas_sp.AAC.1